MNAVSSINSNINALEPVPISQLAKTHTDAGVPTRLAATAETYRFRKAIVMAKRDARTNNTGNIWLGATATNDAQPLQLSPGDVWILEAPTGCRDDFYNWFLDIATSGDGVIILYW